MPSPHNQTEMALHESQQLLETVFNESTDALFLVDAAADVITDCNRRAVTMFEADYKAELIGIAGYELEAENQPTSDLGQIIANLQSGLMIEREVKYRTRKGREFWGGLAANQFQYGQALMWLVRVTDITARKEAEEALCKINRAYQTLSECNQVLVRATDEDQLLAEICQILVEISGYRLAWVGLAEADRTVRPVAWQGYDAGYLAEARITWDESETGQGPTGTAIRTGRPVFSPDIARDPTYAPWRAAAQERGYASSIALPLVNEGDVFGALNIYAGEIDAFDEEEINLLMELAGDIAYGLTALRTRLQHRQAEELLRRYTDRLKILRQVDKALLSARSPRNIAQITLEYLQRLIPYLQAAVVLYDYDNGESFLLVAKGPVVVEKKVPLQKIYKVSRQLKQGKIYQVEDLQALARPSVIEQALQAGNVRGFVVVPMMHHKKLIGSLNIGRAETGPFEPEHLEIAHEVADQLAIAIWQMRLHDQVQRHAADLERRVAERTADLSRANAELARSARLKDEFLANMSHELRTPLNAVLGMAEALIEEIYGPLNQRQRKSVRTIEDSGRHLLALINDILDLSKIEAGKLTLEIQTISVETVCQASLRFVKPLAHKKRLKVFFSLDHAVESIQADERRLKQILVNLLSNAIKFTAEAGEIGLEVIGDEADSVIRFIVWDTGIGISPAKMNRLFKPFVQLDGGLAREHEGTGLGLSLVARLTEMHGGSVAVESEGIPGQGSRFVVTLPWQPEEREGETIAMFETDTASPGLMTDRAPIAGLRRALVVEDSPAAAEQMARYLAELQVEVKIQARGEEAVDNIQTFQPDVILLDIGLESHLTGWDVLRQLKSLPDLRHIPVVIASVLDERMHGLALGAAAYMVKPISRPQLYLILSRIFAPDSAQEMVLALPPAKKKPLALLAEDNETNIITMVDFLIAKGYRVTVARNGMEAVGRAVEEKPDIILMDIQMPIIDGLEATRRIRAEPGLRSTPIIALTALAMPGDEERCLAAGVDLYLSKPVRLRQLVDVMKDQLNR